MNDQRAVEVIGQWLWDKGRTRTTEVGPHAVEILAALRAEGFDLYRPDDCPTAQQLTGDAQDSRWLLVPVGGEG